MSIRSRIEVLDDTCLPGKGKRLFLQDDDTVHGWTPGTLSSPLGTLPQLIQIISPPVSQKQLEHLLQHIPSIPSSQYAGGFV
jgi:hypothetical protein